MELLPPYWRAKRFCYWRRMSGHDYRRRHAYMITMVKEDSVPLFGKICNNRADDPSGAWCARSAVGNAVREAVMWMRAHFAEVSIVVWVIMPDHVHIVLSFRKDGGMSLGEWVGIFKNTANRFAALEGRRPVFVAQYHDRIIRDRAHYEREKRYVVDNPRRAWIRLTAREYFRIAGAVEVNGHRYLLYGNTLLLENPNIEAVKVSRRHTEDEKVRNRRLWQWTAEHGGVLVSPFIHGKEKEAMRLGLEAGCAIILMTVERLTPRYKPGESWLELCAAGRLLIIGEEVYVPADERGYDKNQEMNAAAACIAAGNYRRLPG